MPAMNYARQWMAANPAVRILFHNWYAAPKFTAAVREIDRVASHASWLENFACNRLDGVAMPEGGKDLVDMASLNSLPPDEIRRIAGDGNMGGDYQKPDSDMEAVWAVGVAETRDLLSDGWP